MPIGDFNKTTHLFHVFTAQLTKTLMQCPRGERLHNLLHSCIFTDTWILRCPFFHQENLPCPLKSFLLYLEFCLHSPHLLTLSSLPPFMREEEHGALPAECGTGWRDKHFLLPVVRQTSERESFHLSCPPLYVVPVLHNTHPGALTWRQVLRCCHCIPHCRLHSILG